MSTRKVLVVSLISIATLAAVAQPRISDDRDLKEMDLSAWDCLNKLEGSAKTADGQERNRGKNRSATSLAGLTIPDFDTLIANGTARVLTWDCQPGDAILLHPCTIHGARGNDGQGTQPRRIAMTTRWLGERSTVRR